MADEIDPSAIRRAEKAAWQRAYRAKDRAAYNKYARELHAKNRDRIRKNRRAWYSRNREKVNARSAAWSRANADKVRIRTKRWRANNPEKIRAHQIRTRKARYESHRIWVSNNRERLRAWMREYTARRRREEPEFRLTQSLRTRLRAVLRGHEVSAGAAVRYLGCSVEAARKHLESRFKDGMTWDNWGFYGWHVDHIKPLSSFDLSDQEQLRAACHFTNLQPLWARENLAKSDRLGASL